MFLFSLVLRCMILENTVLYYTDDSTKLAEVSKPNDRVSAVSSLNQDLDQVNEWYKLWISWFIILKGNLWKNEIHVRLLAASTSEMAGIHRLRFVDPSKF